MTVRVTHPIPADGKVDQADYHVDHIVEGLDEAIATAVADAVGDGEPAPGDKGDITVAGGNWSLNPGAVVASLGFTPYDAANPAGYTGDQDLSGYATTSALTTGLNARLASSAVSAFGLTLIDDADAAAARATLGAQVAGSYVAAADLTPYALKATTGTLALSGTTGITLSYGATERIAVTTTGLTLTGIITNNAVNGAEYRLNSGSTSNDSYFHAQTNGTTRARFGWDASALKALVTSTRGLQLNAATGYTADLTVNGAAIASASAAGLAVTGALSATNLSGANTGDETKATIDTKIGATGGTDFYRKDGTWAAPAAANTVSIMDYLPNAATRTAVAAGTNTSNLSTYFQAAFDAMTDGDTLVVPRGIYDIDAAVSTTKAVHIVAYGAGFRIGANVIPFSFNAGYAELKALTATYNPNALSISVTALATALASGQPFRVISDAVDPANRDSGSDTSQYRTGEWAHAGVGSTTTNIVLANPLRFSRGISPTSTAGDEGFVDAYSTSLNARVVTISNKTMSWRGGTFAFDAGNEASWNSRVLQITGYSYPLVEDVTITKGYSQGITVAGTYRATIRNCNVANLTDNTALSQFGYGVADAGYKTLVTGCNFLNCRHGYTTNASKVTAGTTTDSVLLMGRTVGALVISCTGAGGVNAPFDTHHDAEDITFTDCVVDGAAGYGFSLRGRNLTLNNPTVLNSGKGIYVFTEYQSGDADDDFYVAAKPQGLTTATINNARVRVMEEPLTVSGCRDLRVNGWDSESTNHVLVDSTGSAVTFAGIVRHKTTTFDGSRAITTVTNKGIFDANAIASPITGFVQGITFARGCDVSVDARAATDGASNLHAFNAATGTMIDVRGRIDLSLSIAFTSFIVGTAASYTADPESLIVWNKDGTDDNIFSNTLGLRGKVLKAKAADETCWYDNTGINKATEYLVFSSGNVNVTHTGTGAAVTAVYSPPYPVAPQIDEAGHYVRYEIGFSKTGAVGAATIATYIATSFNVNTTIAASDVVGRLVVEVWTLGDNNQRVVVSKSSSPSSGIITAANHQYARIAETTDLAAAAATLLRLAVTAAVGDTITFETVRVYSDVSGFGV